MLKYLLDENVTAAYATQLRRRCPGLVVWVVNDVGAPSKGTLDPEILIWCEEHDFVLVTNNRKSMPGHLADHLMEGRHMPGIFILNAAQSLGQNLEELILIAEGSLAGEYQDQIIHLPLT